MFTVLVQQHGRLCESLQVAHGDVERLQNSRDGTEAGPTHPSLSPLPPFVLMQRGPFLLTLTSCADFPVLCRVEVGGIVAKTTHRLAAHASAVVGSLRFNVGDHPQALSFPMGQNPNTPLPSDLGELDADDAVRVARITSVLLRVAFFEVNKGTVTWNPRSKEPVAVATLYLGAATDLSRIFVRTSGSNSPAVGQPPLDSDASAFTNNDAQTQSNSPPANRDDMVPHGARREDDQKETNSSPDLRGLLASHVAPPSPLDSSDVPSPSRGGDIVAAKTNELINAFLSERVKLIAEVEYWKHRYVELERKVQRDQRAAKAFERLQTATTSQQRRTAAQIVPPAPKASSLSVAASIPIRAASSDAKTAPQSSRSPRDIHRHDSTGPRPSFARPPGYPDPRDTRPASPRGSPLDGTPEQQVTISEGGGYHPAARIPQPSAAPDPPFRPRRSVLFSDPFVSGDD